MPWWMLPQLLVWILQQVELPPQDAERFCNELNPKTIEVALNALVGALFNALYGTVEGMPMTIARVPCGHGYENLATFFLLPPSLDSGALDVLRNELRQFIRQQPDIQFNPTWGRWTWPVCVSAAQAAPTPTRPSESAAVDEAEAIPGSEVGSEESQPPTTPDLVDAPTPTTQANAGTGADAKSTPTASEERSGALNPGASPVEPPRRSRKKKRSRKKTTHQGAQWQTNKRVRRQGPDRFGESDRALFPEMTRTYLKIARRSRSAINVG
jgi:hypothetical protein